MIYRLTNCYICILEDRLDTIDSCLNMIQFSIYSLYLHIKWILYNVLQQFTTGLIYLLNDLGLNIVQLRKWLTW